MHNLTANIRGFFHVVFQITKAEAPIKAFQLEVPQAAPVYCLQTGVSLTETVVFHCSLSLMEIFSFFSFHLCMFVSSAK